MNRPDHNGLAHRAAVGLAWSTHGGLALSRNETIIRGHLREPDGQTPLSPYRLPRNRQPKNMLYLQSGTSPLAPGHLASPLATGSPPCDSDHARTPIPNQSIADPNDLSVHVPDSRVSFGGASQAGSPLRYLSGSLAKKLHFDQAQNTKAMLLVERELSRGRMGAGYQGKGRATVHVPARVAAAMSPAAQVRAQKRDATQATIGIARPADYARENRDVQDMETKEYMHRAVFSSNRPVADQIVNDRVVAISKKLDSLGYTAASPEGEGPPGALRLPDDFVVHQYSPRPQDPPPEPPKTSCVVAIVKKFLCQKGASVKELGLPRISPKCRSLTEQLHLSVEDVFRFRNAFLMAKFRMAPGELQPEDLMKLAGDDENNGEMGSITYDDLYYALGVKHSELSDILLTSGGTDGNRTLSFDEFIIITSTLCLYTKQELLQILFRSFDVDGNGFIEDDEFQQMAFTLQTSGLTYSGNIVRGLHVYDQDGDGMISFDEFVIMADRYPIVLYPAFRIQDLLQEFTLGRGFWLRIQKRLIEDERIAFYLDNQGRLPPELEAQKRLMKRLGCIFPCIRCCPRVYKSVDRKVMELEEVRGARVAARAHYENVFVEEGGEDLDVKNKDLKDLAAGTPMARAKNILDDNDDEEEALKAEEMYFKKKVTNVGSSVAKDGVSRRDKKLMKNAPIAALQRRRKKAQGSWEPDSD